MSLMVQHLSISLISFTNHYSTNASQKCCSYVIFEKCCAKGGEVIQIKSCLAKVKSFVLKFCTLFSAFHLIPIYSREPWTTSYTSMRKRAYSNV